MSLENFRKNKRERLLQRTGSGLSREGQREVSRKYTLKGLLFWLHSPDQRQGILLRGS